MIKICPVKYKSEYNFVTEKLQKQFFSKKNESHELFNGSLVSNPADIC
jgi:hypothetical protein